MGNPIVYFEIGCEDRAATSAFYGDLFAWSIDHAEHASPIDVGGEGINGHITSLGHEPHQYTMFYVGVDDVEATLRRAEELGGRRLVGPIDIPAGTFAWFADPGGNTVGLMKGI